MTTVLVTSTETYIKSVPDASDKEVLAMYRKLSTMESVALRDGRKGTYVEVAFSSGAHWAFDMNNERGPDAIVNSVEPNSNDNLAELLSGLMI